MADEKKIILELTKKEANTLLTVLSLVGGLPKETRRKYIDNIYKRLLEQGVESDYSDVDDNDELRFLKNEEVIAEEKAITAEVEPFCQGCYNDLSRCICSMLQPIDKLI